MDHSEILRTLIQNTILSHRSDCFEWFICPSCRFQNFCSNLELSSIRFSKCFTPAPSFVLPNLSLKITPYLRLGISTVLVDPSSLSNFSRRQWRTTLIGSINLPCRQHNYSDFKAPFECDPCPVGSSHINAAGQKFRPYLSILILAGAEGGDRTSECGGICWLTLCICDVAMLCICYSGTNWFLNFCDTIWNCYVIMFWLCCKVWWAKEIREGF